MAKKSKGSAGFLTKPLNRKSFNKERKAATTLQFGDVERQIGAEKRASDLRQTQIADWFSGPQGYLAKVNALKGSTASAYTQAQTANQGQVNASSAYDEQLRQRLAQEEMDNAKMRGVDYRPQDSQTAANASLNRRNMAEQWTNLVGAQGASQYSYLTDKERIGKGEETNQKLKESARKLSLDSDLRNLATKKGAFKVDYLGKARAAERDYKVALDNLAVQRASVSQRGQAASLSASTSAGNNAATNAQRAADRRSRNRNAAKDRRLRAKLAKKNKKKSGGGSKF